MIAHVVLFRPREYLTAAERDSLIAALRRAVDNISEIQRASVGRRMLLNRPGYETMMRENYEYAAILEFASDDELRRYLDHPAHLELGRILFSSADAVLAYDYEYVPLDRI